MKFNNPSQSIMKKICVILVSITAIVVALFFSQNAAAQTAGQLPQGWTKYDGGTAYSIAVPPTVELRDARDAYSQALKRLNLN